MSLRWEVQGFIPSPSLKQESLDQVKQMTIKNIRLEKEIIEQAIRIKELEQQLKKITVP